MKISINDKVILTIDDTELNILKHGIFDERLEEDISSRIKWILVKKINDSLKTIKEEWYPKIKELGLTEIPIDDYEFAKLVFQQKGYKKRSDRDKLPGKKISLTN